MDYVAQFHRSIFREVYRLLGLDADKATVEIITAVISLLLVLLIAWLANSIVKGFVLGVVRSLAKTAALAAPNFCPDSIGTSIRQLHLRTAPASYCVRARQLAA